MLGLLTPEIVARIQVQQPQLTGKKSLAPIGPRFAAVLPFSILGVQGKVIRMRADELPELLFGCGEYELAITADLLTIGQDETTLIDSNCVAIRVAQIS